MEPVENKLFSVFVTSGEDKFDTMFALAKAVDKHKYSAFQYTRKGDSDWTDAKSIVPYVSMCREVGILNDKLEPFAETNEAFLDGFLTAAKEKITSYCRRNGFSKTALKRKTRQLINQNPPKLPSLDNIYDDLSPKPKLGKTNFKRLLRMKMIRDEMRIEIKLTPILLIDDVIGGKAR